MKHLLIATMALFFTLSVNAKGLKDGHEDCSFACKSIPPMNESYLEFGEASQGTIDSQGFQVLVWNLYKGRNDQYNNEFQRLSRDSDILLLQEVLLDSTMNRSFQLRGEMQYSMAVSFLMKHEEPTGVATASVAAPLEAYHQRTEDKEPFSKSPKTNMVSYFPMDNGQVLLTINIHGMNRRSTEALVRQVEQAKSHIANHSGPVIFAGDFNTRNEERHEAVDQFMASHGLKKMSFPKDPRKLKKQLDVFYYKGLNILNKQLIMDSEGSDHPAILVDAAAK